MNLVLGPQASWPAEIRRLAKSVNLNQIKAVQNRRVITDDVIEILVRIEAVVLRRISNINITIIEFYLLNSILTNGDRRGVLFQTCQRSIRAAINKGLCYLGGVVSGYVFQSSFAPQRHRLAGSNTRQL